MKEEKFEKMLTGGHPNSLGRTIEVVDAIIANEVRLEELYNCYFSNDEVVRLRTSNAMKRVSREKIELLVPYIDRFIEVISKIDQASTQWTLANLFETLSSSMSPEQTKKAKDIMKKNLQSHDDWIVLNNTMQTLSTWALSDAVLKKWLLPHLDRLSADGRKSVSSRAKKLIKYLD
jgi:S-adenosylmethionine hydrolase